MSKTSPNKIPQYVYRTAFGDYRLRRNVPKDIVEVSIHRRSGLVKLRLLLAQHVRCGFAFEGKSSDIWTSDMTKAIICIFGVTGYSR